jgi:hypothetical protein
MHLVPTHSDYTLKTKESLTFKTGPNVTKFQKHWNKTTVLIIKWTSDYTNLVFNCTILNAKNFQKTYTRNIFFVCNKLKRAFHSGTKVKQNKTK